MGLAINFVMVMIKEFVQLSLKKYLFDNYSLEKITNILNVNYKFFILEVEALIALNYATNNKIDSKNIFIMDFIFMNLHQFIKPLKDNLNQIPLN